MALFYTKQLDKEVRKTTDFRIQIATNLNSIILPYDKTKMNQDSGFDSFFSFRDSGVST